MSCWLVADQTCRPPRPFRSRFHHRAQLYGWGNQLIFWAPRRDSPDQRSIGGSRTSLQAKTSPSMLETARTARKGSGLVDVIDALRATGVSLMLGDELGHQCNFFVAAKSERGLLRAQPDITFICKCGVGIDDGGVQNLLAECEIADSIPTAPVMPAVDRATKRETLRFWSRLRSRGQSDSKKYQKSGHQDDCFADSHIQPPGAIFSKWLRGSMQRR